MPVPNISPPPIPKPKPADKYFLRRYTDRDLVIGALPRAKLRQLAAKEQLQWTDELSTDGRTWQQARKRDPGVSERGCHGQSSPNGKPLPAYSASRRCASFRCVRGSD